MVAFQTWWKLRHWGGMYNHKNHKQNWCNFPHLSRQTWGRCGWERKQSCDSQLFDNTGGHFCFFIRTLHPSLKIFLFVPLCKIACGKLRLSYLVAVMLSYFKSLARILTNVLWDYGIFIWTGRQNVVQTLRWLPEWPGEEEKDEGSHITNNKNVCVGIPFPLAALPSAGLGEADEPIWFLRLPWILSWNPDEQVCLDVVGEQQVSAAFPEEE